MIKNPIAYLFFLPYLPMRARGYSHAIGISYACSLASTQLLMITNIFVLWGMFLIMGSEFKQVIEGRIEQIVFVELFFVMLLVYLSVFSGGKFDEVKRTISTKHKFGEAGVWLSILFFFILGLVHLMSLLVVSF